MSDSESRKWAALVWLAMAGIVTFTGLAVALSWSLVHTLVEWLGR